MAPERSYRAEVIGDSVLHIIFYKYVYADSFFMQCKEIQDYAQTGMWYETKITKVYFDLTDTVWFDTLAMCYLLMFAELAQNKNDRENIIFTFPDEHAWENTGNARWEIASFHAFLEDNGFREQMKKIGIVQNLDEVHEISYSAIHTCVWPLQIIHRPDEISGCIEMVQKQLRNEFLQETDLDRQEYLIGKVSYFLQETLDNVYKHGYEDTVQLKPCALLIKRVSSRDYLNRERYKKNYLDHTPYLDIILYNEMTEYLEIYVADIGRGLRESFLNDPSGKDRKITDENILEDILVNGVRSRKKMSQVKQSKYGGLYDIAFMFREDGDKLGFKGDSRWFFDKDKNSSKRISAQVMQHDYTKLVKGFAIIGNICSAKGRLMGSYELTADLQNIVSANMDTLYSKENPWARGKYLKGVMVDDTRFSPNAGTSKTVPIAVIFPEKHLSKEQIYNRLACFDKSKTVIIAGINESEYKKYRTMLESLNLETSNETVILLTNTLFPYVFVRKNKAFCYSKTETRKYIRYPAVKYIQNEENGKEAEPNSIADSYLSLRLWKRGYDSLQMWELMSKKNPMVYINAEIQWGNQPLQGYLDFSQMNLIPECRSLCVEQLFGFLLQHEKVYFRSLDRFTDEICEQANHIMDNSDDDVVYWIGSVFVSGSSERKLDNEGRTEKNSFYFFRHCNHLPEDTSVYSLFEWAKQESWIDQSYPREKYQGKRYSRVGNTSFLADEGSVYWASRHYRNANAVYRLSPADMYQILQNQFGARPPVIKAGHFDAIDHHDLFEVKADAVVETDIIASQMEQPQKCNSYEFLLTEFLHALESAPKCDRLQDYFKNSLSALSGKKIADSLRISLEQTEEKSAYGLVVYLTDYQTSRIVERIKPVFAEKLQERILPIIPIEKNYASSTLLISPLLLDLVEDKINQARKHNQSACGNDAVAVTLFIASSFTMRLQEELKHIIMCMGASQVKILSLIDRQRMPFGRYITEKNVAYTRLDVPAIGFSDTCPICSALNTLDYLESFLRDPVLTGRNRDIIKQWRPVKSSDNHRKKGIPIRHIVLPEDIQKSLQSHVMNYHQEEVNVTTDFGLVLFSVENTVISLSSSFLDDCIRSKELESSVKLLLLSAHILTFNEFQLSEKYYCWLIEQLCSLLQAEKTTSDYTSLAVIALCGQSFQFLKYTQKCFEKLIRNMCGSKNNDALLLRLAIYKKLGSELGKTNTEENRNRMDLETSKDCRRELHCYLKNELNALEMIYDLFLYSEPEYKQSHRQVFGKIEGTQLKLPSADYRLAQKYVQKLRAIFNGDRMKSLYYNTEYYEGQREKILASLAELLVLLEKEVETDDDHENVSSKLSSALKLIQDVNKRLYLQRDHKNSEVDIQIWLKYCIDAAHKRCSREGIRIKPLIFCAPGGEKTEAQKHPDFSPRFFVHADVTEEVINLIVDIIVHSTSRLRNFVDSEKEGFEDGEEGADGIIMVSFTDNYAKLLFYNATRDTKRIEEIRAVKRSKYNRPSMLTFRQFDERLPYDEELPLSDGENGIRCFRWNYAEKHHPAYCLDENENVSGHLFCAEMRIPYIDQGSEFGNK